MSGVFDNGEIELYGYRFRVTPDPIQESLVSTFPGKIVVGDPRRVDDPVASSYVMQDWTGGGLKRWMDPSTDFDRFYYSTCATWYTRQLTLNGQVRTVTPSLAAPGSPSFSLAGGGGWSGGQFNVAVSYTNASGTLETLPSAVTNFNAGAVNNQVIITSPPALTGATGYFVYFTLNGANATGSMYRAPNGSSLTTPFTIGSNATFSLPVTGANQYQPLTTPSALLWADGVGRNVRAGAAYAGRQYLGFDEFLCYLDSNEVVQQLGTVGSVGNVITDMKVYRIMSGANSGATWLVISYINSGTGVTGFATYDGTTLSAGSGTCAAMTVWDSKLVRCDDTGALKYSLDLSTWNPLPGQNVVPLTEGSVTSMTVYPDGFWGLDEIQIATTTGLYWYDEIGQQVRATRLSGLPSLPNSGRPLTNHKSNLYVPAPATQVLRYTGDTVSPEGLDRDDGLPSTYRGQITWLSSTLNFLVASTMSNIAATINNPVWGSSPMVYADVMPGTAGYAALWIQTRVGGGWHNIYASDVAGTAIYWVGASAADSKYRLFFGTNGKVGVIDLYDDLVNPLDNTIQQFQTTGVHVTPWNEQGWSEIEKLALSQKFGVKGPGLVSNGANCTTTVRPACNIVVEYAKDYDEINWLPLTTITTGTPPPVYYGNGNVGVPTKAIRFRYTLNRCDDPSHTPVLVWSTLAFLKVQDARWGYEFTLDLTTTEQGLTPADQAALLRSMADPAGLGATMGVFRGFVAGKFQERNVKVSELIGMVKGGNKQSGMYKVSLVAF